MTSACKTNFKFLPQDIYSHCMGWLPPTQVLETAKVCKAWHAQSQDERIWKAQCDAQNVFPDSSGAVAYGLETMIGSCFSEEGTAPADSRRCWKIVKLIAEYAPDCMHRAKILIQTARVEFYREAWEVNVLSKQRNSCARRWGIDEDEPMICIRIKSETDERVNAWVLRRFLSQHPNKDRQNWASSDVAALLKSMERFPAGEIPPPKFNEHLPSHMPLRFFFDRQGNCKEAGDSIRLTVQGRKVILLCTHSPETCPTHPPVAINTFTQALLERISIGLQNQSFSTQTLDRTKALAKAAPAWISPA